MKEDMDVTAAAKVVSKLGASKGGLARADALSPEERKRIAQKAIMTRWPKIEHNRGETEVPRATHSGVLAIGDVSIPCAVLEDGTRVLTQWGFFRAIGRSGRPAAGRGSDVEKVAPFLALDNLKPYIYNELSTSTRPIIFRLPSGIKAYGYKAELLPKVCNVYLQARDDGALLKSREKFAKACDILIQGFATVGIIGLIDEATGYQEDRPRDELHKILAAYIAKELLPWAKRFPDEFDQKMFRLRGWQYSPMTKKGPLFAGKLVNRIVYEKLPPGVLDELRTRNPVIQRGCRKHKHHQFLAEDIGHPHLEKHLVAVTTLMRVSHNWKGFETFLEKAFPSYEISAQHIAMDLHEDNTGGIDRSEE